MCELDELIESSVTGIARICQNFAHELGGLVSPVSAWIMLTKRHCFTADPETIDAVGDMVLRLLLPPEHAPGEQMIANEIAVVCPEDRSDDGEVSQDGGNDHVTEVFVPNCDAYSPVDEP